MRKQKLREFTWLKLTRPINWKSRALNSGRWVFHCCAPPPEWPECRSGCFWPLHCYRLQPLDSSPLDTPWGGQALFLALLPSLCVCTWVPTREAFPEASTSPTDKEASKADLRFQVHSHSGFQSLSRTAPIMCGHWW